MSRNNGLNLWKCSVFFMVLGAILTGVVYYLSMDPVSIFVIKLGTVNIYPDVQLGVSVGLFGFGLVFLPIFIYAGRVYQNIIVWIGLILLSILFLGGVLFAYYPLSKTVLGAPYGSYIDIKGEDGTKVSFLTVHNPMTKGSSIEKNYYDDEGMKFTLGSGSNDTDYYYVTKGNNDKIKVEYATLTKMLQKGSFMSQMMDTIGLDKLGL
ncbi:MAG: hypothetical protein J5786_05180 [Clostridiales bacterium]|nr:hypothetical protein [Clostridiales bacterium]